MEDDEIEARIKALRERWFELEAQVDALRMARRTYRKLGRELETDDPFEFAELMDRRERELLAERLACVEGMQALQPHIDMSMERMRLEEDLDDETPDRLS